MERSSKGSFSDAAHWTHPRAGRRGIIGWWLEGAECNPMNRNRVLGRIHRHTARSMWRADWYQPGVRGYERVYQGWSILEAARALERVVGEGRRA